MTENPYVTLREIAKMLDKDYSTIRKSIKKLKEEKDMIERVGSDKT